MKKLKVAFCLRDMKIGGVENVFINTLENLLARGDVEIFVLTYSRVRTPLYAKWFDAHPQVHTATLYPSRFLGTDLSHFFLLRLVQHFCRSVYRRIRRFFINWDQWRDIDVFVDYYNFSFHREFKKVPVPKIVWWHSSLQQFIAQNAAQYMPNYDLMVALTPGFVADFKRMYPQYANKITHIFNPVDIASVVARAENADSVKVSDYFVCVSRLYADKDINTLLRGFNKFWCDNARPDVKLVIIGDGSWADRYKAIANALDAAPNIIFTGSLSNPFGYMKNAIANILSSYSEGLGMVLIEGAIVKTLNISSDCQNGPRDILLDGRGGMLYNPGDADGLAQCMTNAWRGGVDIDEMICAAYDGLARFDASVISNQIYDLLKEYAKRNRN